MDRSRRITDTRSTIRQRPLRQGLGISIIVLMTDGTEEWPISTVTSTGLGWLEDGKIGTSSSSGTAQTNLDTRLAERL